MHLNGNEHQWVASMPGADSHRRLIFTPQLRQQLVESESGNEPALAHGWRALRVWPLHGGIGGSCGVGRVSEAFRAFFDCACLCQELHRGSSRAVLTYAALIGVPFRDGHSCTASSTC